MTGKDMIFAMTKEQYIKITEPLRSNPERANRVTSLNHVLTALVFCVYPLYLFMLFTDKNPWLWRAILVPAVSFVVPVVRQIGAQTKSRHRPSWDFPLSGKSSMRQDRMKNLTCRRYWKKTQKENHFQAGMYFLFLLLR